MKEIPFSKCVFQLKSITNAWLALCARTNIFRSFLFSLQSLNALATFILCWRKKERNKKNKKKYLVFFVPDVYFVFAHLFWHFASHERLNNVYSTFFCSSKIFAVFSQVWKSSRHFWEAALVMMASIKLTTATHHQCRFVFPLNAISILLIGLD